jgi:hypothetical protein
MKTIIKPPSSVLADRENNQLQKENVMLKNFLSEPLFYNHDHKSWLSSTGHSWWKDSDLRDYFHLPVVTPSAIWFNASLTPSPEAYHFIFDPVKHSCAFRFVVELTKGKEIEREEISIYYHFYQFLINSLMHLHGLPPRESISILKPSPSLHFSLYYEL